MRARNEVMSERLGAIERCRRLDWGFGQYTLERLQGSTCIRMGLCERFQPFTDLSIAMSRQIFVDRGRRHYAAKNKQGRGRR